MQESKPNQENRDTLTENKPKKQDGGPGFFARIFDLKDGWYKQRDIARNNHATGLRQFKQGNVSDAILRFKIVTWLRPQDATGWYWLGRSYLRDKKHGHALQALQKAAQLRSGDEHIQYMMAVAMGDKAPAGMLPTHIPPGLVKEHYDWIAHNYNQIIAAEPRNEHVQVASAARKELTEGRIDHVILDLGCGTGLCGSRLKDISAQLTGVDHSAGMLEEAKRLTDNNGKKIYDALIHREALEFLQEIADGAFDIILASGFARYLGDLGPLFVHAGRTLKSGGVMVVSLPYSAEHDYRFDAAHEIFIYSSDYVSSSAEGAGLKVKSVTQADFAPGHKGLLCVFSK